jgi:hypothetical protein
MKTKLVKRILAPLVVACALVPMVATTATRPGTVGGRLQGTWEMQITLTDCAGHVIRSFPPGEGVWRHTTDNNYAFRFKFFTFSPQNVFTGWTIISGETTVDETGDANTGSATVEVYDPNGVLVATVCASTVGTRFEL